MMDERMCRPGYRWNDTLKRCLAAGGVGNGEDIGDLPDADIEPKPAKNPASRRSRLEVVAACV